MIACFACQELFQGIISQGDHKMCEILKPKSAIEGLRNRGDESQSLSDTGTVTQKDLRHRPHGQKKSLGRYHLTLPFFVYNIFRASRHRNEATLCIESFSAY